MPSIVKELAVEARDSRLEQTIHTYVKDMNRDKLESYAIGQLDDYYTNVASDEEVDEFINDNQYLPF